MARVRSKDTAPEWEVRRALFREGFRFRLHVRKLPGCPDIVLSRLRVAVFVNGCFWHGHDCRRGRQPASNTEFWDRKIQLNVERDQAAETELLRLGWKVRTLWECQLQGGIKGLVQELKSAVTKAG